MYQYGALSQTRRRNGKLAQITAFTFIAAVGLYIFYIDNDIIKRLQPILTTLQFQNSNTGSKDDADEEDDGLYKGVYPNSLITLFYPYTLLRDVVLAQPVSDSDIPFFWHLHGSDERTMKRILTTCFGLELVELDDLDSIERAKETGLVATLDRYKHVITSPHIRPICEIFTVDHFARMFSFFRHPLDYDLHPALPTFEETDNWLTRYLSDLHEGDITFKQLGVAKHVVRECTVVGTLDKMRGSILRIKAYFGWEYADGMTDFAGERCVDDALAEEPVEETWIDHGGVEWDEHYAMNRYDCEVYEIAQSAWRAQIQTMVPYDIQLGRKKMLDEQEAKDKAKWESTDKSDELKFIEDEGKGKRRKRFGIF